jgi:hypothetical protein
MSIRTAIRDWLNKPSANEVRAALLDTRLTDIEMAVTNIAAVVESDQMCRGLASWDVLPLSSEESERIREDHRASLGL